MRTRIPWILAAAGLLVAAILFLAHAGSDPRAGRQSREADAPSAAAQGGSGGGEFRTAPDPSEAGAAGAAAALQGTVRDEEGPVRGAIVYLLPKNVPGVDDASDFRQGARTGRDGRWTLPAARPAGCWLGVVADGRRMRFLDGDALPPDPLDIALEPGFELEIAFGVNEAVAARQVHLSVVTARDVPAFSFPGPGAQLRRNINALLEVDRPFTLSFEGPGPYDVEIGGERLYWEPVAQKVAAPGRAFFLLLPSATIAVELTDAATGDRFADAGVLTVRDGAGGTVASDAGRSFQREMSRRILPGTYDLEFRTPGYKPWHARGVRIDDAGAEVRLEAALVRDPALGELRVRGITAAGAAVRRVGDSAWVQPHLERRGEGLTRLRGIEAGTVDVLLWTAEGSEVAVLTGVDVPGGGVVEPKAALVTGAFLEPAPLGVEAGSELRIEAEALGTLPFVVPGGVLPPVGGAWPGEGAPVGRLGPFPCVPGLRLVERRAGRETVHPLPDSATRPGR